VLGSKSNISKGVFGETIQKQFKIGDLVEWHFFSQSSKDKVDIEIFKGVIIEFYKELETGRPVCMARVLPINSNLVLEIPCITLKKNRN
tara:strand:- start:144 stop:410 length:267 start_codon:yes stop_codon:yes gene_type:complete